MAGLRLVAAALAGAAATPAAATIAGDAAACAGGAPAVRAEILGLKDRTGRVKLELYPANTADFLRDDRELRAAGKTFRRVWATVPASGPLTLCLRVPHPGPYAIFFTHDRDGRNKFNVWSDGAGAPGNARFGRAPPRLANSLVTVGQHPLPVTIRAQYLHGFPPAFAPLGK